MKPQPIFFRDHLHWLAACAAIVLTTNPTQADERIRWSSGHGDIQVQYVNGAWEYGVQNGSHAEDVIIELGEATRTVIPSSTNFAFLGTPGAPIWIISQSEVSGVPFVGWSSEGMTSGTFVGDRFDLNVASVRGPGDVFIWTTGTGTVDVDVNTTDGLDSNDVLNFPAPGHFHNNIGFTQPGTYFVGIQPTGSLQAGGSTTGALEEIRFAVNVLDQGEVDLELLYANGNWEMAYLKEATAQEFATDHAVLHASPKSWTTVPAEEAFGFLGAPGSSVYVLPQTETDGVLYLGMAADEIPAGVFQGESIDLTLQSVQGPGDVYLYGNDSFGSPVVHFNSRDGIDSSDRFTLSTGAHYHQNWAFSQPGDYVVKVKASGILLDGGATTTSPEFEIRFEVLPPTFFETGEVDLEITYAAGTWGSEIHDHASDSHHGFEETIWVAAKTSLEPVPSASSFQFLGDPGDRIHLLPQTEKSGLLFPGLATEEIPEGVFQNNEIFLELISCEGPGNFFLYAVDAFGEATASINSSNGISTDDRVALSAGGHAHFNWGFSRPGVYRLEFKPGGTLTSNGLVSSGDAFVLTVHVLSPQVLNRGEVDVEITYDGTLNWSVLQEVPAAEYELSEILLQGLYPIKKTIPSDASFAFLGTAGNPVWILPQTEIPNVLFLGLATDEIPPGVFVGEALQAKLLQVRGPGHLSLYAEDTFGMPGTPFFNSADGVDASDVLPLGVGGHSHLNWGFTAPGLYKAALQVEGTLISGSSLAQSPVVEFTFEVLDIELGFQRTSNQTLSVSFPSVLNHRYQLQSSPGLPASWSNSGASFLGDGEFMSLELNIPSTNHSIFRLVDEGVVAE